MLRKLLVVALIILIAAPVVDARRRTPPSGKVDNDIYTDSQYGFQFKVHENWKPGVNKEKDKARVVLTQRKYDIPLDYINVPHYTWVPTLTVFVDSAKMNIHILIDSLLSDEYKSDLKDEIRKEFEFLDQPDIVPKGRSRFEFAGESGLLWTAQAQYMKEVQTSASSVGGKRVRSSYGGAIAAVEHNGMYYLFFLMCEWPFFDNVLAEATQMITSLEFTDQQSPDGKKGKGK